MNEKKDQTHVMARRNNMAAVDVALQRSAAINDNDHAYDNSTVTARLADVTHACLLPICRITSL
jgi:hypothetical protein